MGHPREGEVPNSLDSFRDGESPTCHELTDFFLLFGYREKEENYIVF